MSRPTVLSRSFARYVSFASAVFSNQRLKSARSVAPCLSRCWRIAVEISGLRCDASLSSSNVTAPSSQRRRETAVFSQNGSSSVFKSFFCIPRSTHAWEKTAMVFPSCAAQISFRPPRNRSVYSSHVSLPSTCQFRSSKLNLSMSCFSKRSK